MLLRIIKVASLFGITAIGVALFADSQLTEAPTGLTTPTLAVNPGSQSTSNGIPEPTGDTFSRDQQAFELRHDLSTGLGPVYNATACAECHQNGVSGAASQMTELRAGHLDSSGSFVAPTISINDGLNTIAGRSIINDRAVCPQAQEHLPATETIRTLRAVLPLLGDGFVEAVDDQVLLNIAASQPGQSEGFIHGEAIEVPVLEATGITRVGRFGWKDQDPTLLSFAGDAYFNEMGVTSRLHKTDTTTVCKTGNTTAVEDTPDELGLADIDHFAQFIRGLRAPPRDTVAAANPAAIAGAELFTTVGCATCHVPTLTTVAPGTVLNGGTYTVSNAIGNKIFHPYSDFLLHDVGTGDGIYQAGPTDTLTKLRTPALWGLHIRSRFMHDLRALTLEEAIERHRGEASRVHDHFRDLSDAQRQNLLTFLSSL